MHDQGQVLPIFNIAENMEVVGHQTVMMHFPRIAALGATDQGLKKQEVTAGMKNKKAVIGSCDEVVIRTVLRLPGSSGHG